MDDLRFGAVVRAARIHRRWRQGDLAAAAGVSRACVSRLERGVCATMGLPAIRRIGAALEIGVELEPRSRGGSLSRLANERHSMLAEAVIRRLTAIGGWAVRPEVSFAIYGDRGVVDLLAWHAATRSLLVIELKTAIVDVGELLATFGRKRRRGTDIAAQFDWRPRSVSTWLVVAESMTNRRRVRQHEASFRAAQPDDGRRLRSWLAAPARAVDALTFFSSAHGRSVRSPFAQIQRVRRPRQTPG